MRSPDEFVSDPENRLLARGARYRMDAEMIRDQILFVSGKLNREDVRRKRQATAAAGFMGSGQHGFSVYLRRQTQGDAIYRRSFYTYWKRRALPPPQMTILNAPSREFCAPHGASAPTRRCRRCY